MCATTVVSVGTLRATVLTRRRDGGEGFCATHASVHCSMIKRDLKKRRVITATSSSPECTMPRPGGLWHTRQQLLDSQNPQR